MSGKKAMNMMEMAVACLDDAHGNIILDKTMSIMDGSTEDGVYFVTHRVGVKEFAESPAEQFSYVQVAGALTVLFHEVCGHGGMLFSEINKETDLSKVLLLNHHACQGSPSYCGAFGRGDVPADRRDEFTEGIGDRIVLPRYFKHPREIASQYAAFRSAHLFLSEVWGEDLSNECLCAYHAERVNDGISYIEHGRKRARVDQILGDLNKEFRAKAFQKREYDSSLGLADVIMTSGAAGRYVCAIEQMKNGVKADALMTALYLKKNDPNNVRSWSAALVRIPQDPERILAMEGEPVKKLFFGNNVNLVGMDEHVMPDRVRVLVAKYGDMDGKSDAGHDELGG